MHSRRSESWPTSPIRISPNISDSFNSWSTHWCYSAPGSRALTSFIAITRNNRCAYRITKAADALPLPRHLAHWSPEGKAAFRRWSVLNDEGPKDWMSTALRAHDLVQSELGDVPWVVEKTGRKA
jgi:hypothetical protein